jgi:hypothetical protein
LISTGSENVATAGPSLPLNAWSHLAATYDAFTLKLYVNGVLRDSVSASSSLPAGHGPLRLGGDSFWGEWFEGNMDDVRVYNRALSAAEIEADMDTPIADVAADSTPPAVAITSPSNDATVGETVSITASASDNQALAGVRFLVDGQSLDNQDTTAPYSIAWNSRTVANGTHTISARARDVAGNATTTTISVTVANQPSAPVAAYGFDEGSGTIAADASGGMNTGDVSGASWTSAGKHGGALSFDGIDDWVTIADSPALDLTAAMTLEAWVRPTSLVGWSCVLMKEFDSDLSYSLYANDNNDQPGTWLASEFGTTNSSAPDQLPPDQWTHLAATFDDSTAKLYVNGTLEATQTADDPLRTSSSPLRIGGDAPWGEWFEGTIDDVRIYDRALSAAEIVTDMGTPVTAGDCSGTLDDGNPCTDDACTSSGITHTPVATGTSCSDGNACNGAETCDSGGVCVSGTAPTTDDNNPCTTDACDPSGGVTHTPVATGTSCSDGNVCNGAETCNASAVCTSGTPPTTDDGNPCTTDACDPATGVTHTPVAAGTTCSDGNACNGAETCNATGSCMAGTPVTCVALDQCHEIGTCNASTGICSNPAKTNGSPCSDGDTCTQVDSCQAGSCVGANAVVCTASDTCHNAGTCDSATGQCSNPAKADGASCSDNNVCNGNEACSGGICTGGTPLVIDDGNACTADSCSPTAGVTHTLVASGTDCGNGRTCDASGACVCPPGQCCTPGTSSPLTTATCDRSVATDFAAAVAPLYVPTAQVPSPPQQAVTNQLDPARIAVVLGRLFDRDGKSRGMRTRDRR